MATTSYAWPLVTLTAVHGGTGGEWGRDQLAVSSSLGLAQLGADVAKRRPIALQVGAGRRSLGLVGMVGVE